MANSFHLEEVLPDAAVGPVRLPRRGAATSPQGMAVTLLADYSLSTRAWLPSSAIVALLTESGVTTASVRTAMSRLARRGVLESCRRGRNAFYRLTPSAALALTLGGSEIAAFPSAAEIWDDSWTLIAFSVPQHGDTERHALRSRLRWMGYAPLYDGLWVSPHGLSDKAADALADFSIAAMTVFRASQVEFNAVNSRAPLDAWDVETIGKQYEQFLQQWRPLVPRIQSGTVSGAEAVRARTEVMDAYRQFVVLDPRLPMRMMPAGWPRPDAHALFAAIYDGLADRALRHVLEVVAGCTTDPQLDIRPHSISELQAGLATAPATCPPEHPPS